MNSFFAPVFSSQCWVRTASPCTPPCSTRTCTWSARTRRASPTSGSRSSWTPRASLAPANQRRPGCGIAAMESGSTFTSTAQERLPRHYSDQVHNTHTPDSVKGIFHGLFNPLSKASWDRVEQPLKRWDLWIATLSSCSHFSTDSQVANTLLSMGPRANCH